jgi:hypothetical protein
MSGEKKSDDIVRLPSCIGQEHEPVTLIALRVMIVVAFLAGLSAYAAFQILRQLHGTLVQHIDTSIEPFVVPWITVYIPTNQLRGANITFNGWYYDASGQLSSHEFSEGEAYSLEHGEDKPQLPSVFEGIPKIGQMDRLSVGNVSVIQTSLDNSWKFVPSSVRHKGNQPPNEFVALDLVIRGNVSAKIEHVAIEVATLPRQSSGELANIEAPISDAYTTLTWDSTYEISLVQSMVKSSNGTVSVHLRPSVATQFQNSYPGIAVRFLSGNPADTSGAGWVTLTTSYHSLLHWSQTITDIVAAALLAFVLYTILFGQPRLKTWGLLQRYVFRDQILEKAPTGKTAAETRAPAWVAQEYMQSGAKLPMRMERKHTDTPQPDGYRAPTPYLPPEWVYQSDDQYPNRNNQISPSVIRRINAIEARLSTLTRYINELRAFRDRTAMFYLRDDLFRERVPIIEHEVNMNYITNNDIVNDYAVQDETSESWRPNNIPYSPSVSYYDNDTREVCSKFECNDRR